MEEAVPIEKQQQLNQDLKISCPVQLPLDSGDDNDKVKEVINSGIEVDQTIPTPDDLGDKTQESVDNCIANSFNNTDNQTISETAILEEKNQSKIDHEKEPLDNDKNKDNLRVEEAVAPRDSEERGVEGIEHLMDTEHNNDGELSSKSNNYEVDANQQLEREENSKEVPKEDSVCKIEVKEETTEVVPTVTQPSEQKADKESPGGDVGKAGVLSEEATEVAPSVTQLPSQIADKDSPKLDVGKTEVLSEEITEILKSENLATEQFIDKESPKGETSEITTSTSGKEEKKKEIEESEAVNTKAKTAGDNETGAEEKLQDGKDQKEVDLTEAVKQENKIPENSQLHSTWNNGGEEKNTKQGEEEYLTSVDGSEVTCQPLSSNSDESKKPAKGTSSGSVFKKMSWGSLFKRKKSIKDKPEIPVQQQTETEMHDETDGMPKVQSDNTNKVESTSVHAGEGAISKEAVGPSEPLVEKPYENEPEVSAKEDIPEGAIVPLEEGVTENDQEANETTDENLQQVEHKDELKDDIETPMDEDSVLRERIAKRESATSSLSPTKHMQLRMSYAEGSKEVEVIGTREIPPQSKQFKPKTNSENRLSCRELGEVDHEGWLTKRGGGTVFASWKRKWVVLKEQTLYYYKTAFDLEAGGVVSLENQTIAPAPEMKKKFCFKIEAEDPKPHKMYFAADTQEDMDKWLSYLSSASRGETIVRRTNNQQTSDVKMRKKTNSIGQRPGSVLGLGGYYEYDGDLEKTDQKRRTSFGSSPNITANTILHKNGHNVSATEDATPSDIQKLMTGQGVGDEVAPVTIETTTPLNEESCSAEVVPATAANDSTVVSDAQTTPQNMEIEIKTSSENLNDDYGPGVEPLEQVDGITEEKMTSNEDIQSEIKESSGEPEDALVSRPSVLPKISTPNNPTNTTWYYTLDSGTNDWIDIDAKEDDSDELLSLVRTIKDARLSIIGTPLPGNQERARALTNVSKQNSEVLKLREMKRTLKDKQRDLLAMEELLSRGIDRQSLHEWKARYSYLLFEQDAIYENGSMDGKDDSSDDNNKGVDSAGVQDCEDVICGEVGDNRTKGDVQEVNLNDSGNTDNSKQENVKSVHMDSGKPADGGENQDGGECQNGGENKEGGRPQEITPEDGRESQPGGEKEDKEAVQDHVETRGESPKDTKVEEKGDLSITANTKDASLVKEEVSDIVADKSINMQDSVNIAAESEEPAIQGKMTPEQNNNTESSKNTKEMQIEEPLQEQDNMDTHL